jgi:hypothetical protein
MHSSESALHSFFYGYDRESFFFRIDGAVPLDQLLNQGDILYIHLVVQKKEFRIGFGLGEEGGYVQAKGAVGFRAKRSRFACQIRRVCEVKIPISAVKPLQGESFQLFLALHRGGEEVGRWPADSPMELKYLGETLELDNWLI